MLMFDRINPCSILRNHFSTLYHADTKKLAIVEIFVHLFLPVCIAVWLTCFKNIYITKDMAGSLFSGFAIMGGFLINASFILAEKRDSVKQKSANDDYEELLKETFYNTSYGIFICFVAVIFCAVYPLFLNDQGNVETSGGYIISGAVFSLSFMFLLTIMMVLKRLNAIFTQ